MKHIARKRFGQHFLSDRSIIEDIVQAIAPQPGDPMVEIGPGLAALTQPLVERLGRLTVIELDRDLAVRLRLHGQLDVIESDVLKVDFTQLAQALGAIKIRVVGNLPYNISTPILFHLLEHVDVIADQHFMLQKEVVDRMVAVPSTSDYSRLSVMLQWRYAMENVLFVPPESFDPPPRVFCATRWGAGWKRVALPAALMCSAALKRCRYTSTRRWPPVCPRRLDTSLRWPLRRFAAPQSCLAFATGSGRARPPGPQRRACRPAVRVLSHRPAPSWRRPGR